MNVAFWLEPGGRLLPGRAALHESLLAGQSATTLLEQLCGGPIKARRLSPDTTHHAWPDDMPTTADQDPGPVIRRHVDLVCGTQTLSTAMLWYAEHRLPSPLARCLADTDQPFGRVLKGLGVQRITLSARLCEPDEVWALEHRAALSLPGGARLALVEERYSWALFAAP